MHFDVQISVPPAPKPFFSNMSMIRHEERIEQLLGILVNSDVGCVNPMKEYCR